MRAMIIDAAQRSHIAYIYSNSRYSWCTYCHM